MLLKCTCGVIRQLASQKLINKPGWWKGKLVLFQKPATGDRGRVAYICPKANSASALTSSVEGIYRQSCGGFHAERAQSSLTVMVISGLTSITLVGRFSQWGLGSGVGVQGLCCLSAAQGGEKHHTNTNTSSKIRIERSSVQYLEGHREILVQGGRGDSLTWKLSIFKIF